MEITMTVELGRTAAEGHGIVAEISRMTCESEGLDQSLKMKNSLIFLETEIWPNEGEKRIVIKIFVDEQLYAKGKVRYIKGDDGRVHCAGVEVCEVLDKSMCISGIEEGSVLELDNSNVSYPHPVKAPDLFIFLYDILFDGKLVARGSLGSFFPSELAKSHSMSFSYAIALKEVIAD
jgi:hypothetical protein